jgi:hypothetical protein
MSVQTIINGAKEAQYVTDIIRASGRLFNVGMTDFLPRLIYCTRKSVEWLFDQDPNDDTLTATSDYLLAISVLYWSPETSISNASGGGAGVAPVVSAPNSPLPYDFEVTGSSFIIGGQSVKTINSFIGYNIIFTRNNIVQSTVDTGGSYYSWNLNSGLFVCFPAAASGELFTITAV